ncbi:glutathione-independent formaldehyde dehydrogenase [Streptomyces sp. NRRL WC-3549]|uniref:glutathione-independent formaldehyde dehydrogenase n=1 Tax=Streptomyces sp. NRRL WC-3549 TaxID=1463925 RepID=UPI0004C731F2|nr:glutathione-independent formaldehyde dehydrogenase [Streptomyces sp. NRRL WC-3549]
MKAVVYNGPRDVSVSEVPDARIEHPGDIVVRVTATNICGSDLHMYEGRTSFEPGRILGHEAMGEVVETGPAVSKVEVGDHVVLPFNIACGFCKQCERGLTNYCLTMQPEPALAGAAFGFAEMGPYAGGQAEYLRVPHGDFNALRLGEDAAARQNDYVMLADVFPTGYHATEMAGVKPGDQTLVLGAGPVGLMAAYSAVLKGAGRVWVADHQTDRLELAEHVGAIPIDTREQDPAEVVKEATLGLGADNGCECVGYQAHDPQGEEDAALTLNQLVDAVRFTGRIGVVGVFLPQDPGGKKAQNALEAKGRIPFDYGLMWFKGQSMGTGQAPVKRYNRALRDLIAGGVAEPSFLVSHQLPLDRAPAAYEKFDAREPGWTKVVLRPESAAA